MRFRRKLVLRDGGSACHRLIMSRSARSLSRARAVSFVRRAGRLFKGALQNLHDREVAGPPRGLLAADDICE